MLERLGGYRIVRKLGEGTHAQVLLAHPEHGDEAPVALKVYREGMVDVAILTELEALHRAGGPHVVALLDVAADERGTPVAVLERLPGGTLARLLRERARLEPGEAITILAPLALALARLHDAGVLHGAVAAESVLFDAAGAPVLACFGRARVVPAGLAPAAREAEPGFAADLAGFAALTGSVLDRVPGAPASFDPLRPAAFAEQLFAWAEAAPVRLEADLVQPELPARLVTGEPLPSPPPEAVAMGLPDWVTRLVPEGLAERVLGSVRAVRRPVWIAAAGVAFAVVAAVVLIPTGGGSAGEEPRPSPSPSDSVVDVGPVGEDDPVAAAVALLQARDRCIRDLSVLCLDSVAQAGSAALADDQSLVLALQAGAEAPEPIGWDEVVLVERLGDTAIVALGAQTQPASLLLMRGEAGWRIRQYLTE